MRDSGDCLDLKNSSVEPESLTMGEEVIGGILLNSFPYLFPLYHTYILLVICVQSTLDNSLQKRLGDCSKQRVRPLLCENMLISQHSCKMW